MKTTYYSFSYDGGMHGGEHWLRRATVSVTENRIGRRHVKVIGQPAQEDHWQLFLESIEQGFIRAPHGLRELH